MLTCSSMRCVAALSIASTMACCSDAVGASDADYDASQEAAARCVRKIILTYMHAYTFATDHDTCQPTHDVL
jgi:hypothetical protein